MNESPNYLKIFSSAKKLRSNTNSLVALSALTALTDLTSVIITCTGFNYVEQQEGETVDGMGGFKADVAKLRGAFSITTDKYFPNKDETLYHATLNVLRKPARYIQLLASDISEYTTNSTLYGTSQQALSVVMTEFETDTESGKSFNIKFEKDRTYE